MADVKRILRLVLINGANQKELLKSYERGFYCIRFDICDEQCEACYECGDSPYCDCGAVHQGINSGLHCEACGKII